MGFLKKLTKPLSKFLDKIVPNEIKPALPYLSAFAPFMMGPGIMGAGMLQRGLMSGALNIGSQLAQEGSEGDVDWLSAALAGGIGSLTAPGTPGKAMGVDKFGNTMYLPGSGTQSASDFLAGKAKAMDTGFLKSGTEMLGKSAGWLDTQGDILRPGGAPLTLKNALTAASVPVTQGTADLARITAEQELKRLNDEEEETGIGINDEGRRRAIRAAMEAGGHGEEAILDALASVGLRSGGIVGLKHGGQLVKHGPGRPGYGGPHETEAAGRAYEAATSPGGGGGDAWQQQALKDFAKLSSTVTNPSDIDPQFQHLVKPAAAIKPSFLKKQGWYNNPLNFGINNLALYGLGSSNPALADLYKGLGNPDLTIGSLLEQMQTGKYDKLPTKITDKLQEHVLGNIDFGDTFQENWSMGMVEPTFQNNRLDIDETELEVPEMKVRPEDVLELGVKEGGRVGALGGGIMHAKRGLVNAPGGYAGEKEEVDFGGITEAVTAVEKTPKKFLVDKLEVTVMPGQSEEMAIVNAMINDTDGVMPDDRKQEFYRLFLPQLKESGEISETEYNGLMGELFKANGGRINKEGGGMMSVLPKGREMDYRGGGVIPIGSRERADDVPARLSKNEFVMTADAVKAAGGGSVNRGAKKMYNLMHNLEARV
jgi:hypothetical protein